MQPVNFYSSEFPRSSFDSMSASFLVEEVEEDEDQEENRPSGQLETRVDHTEATRVESDSSKECSEFNEEAKNDHPISDKTSSPSSPRVDVVGATDSLRRLWNLEPIVEEIRQTSTDAFEILLTELSKDEYFVDNEGLHRTLLLMCLHPIFEGVEGGRRKLP